ncbi:hypothetical protein FRC07_003074 [Ceratobasidium sp. 392]|nr:hypothetical protein FRC07_003074 [Ceratobasidium sp. 392]
MAPKQKSTGEEWIEPIIGQMLSQTRNVFRQSSKGGGKETTTSDAAQNARRIVRIALFMAIDILDAADERQIEADRLLQDRLELIQEQLKAQKLKEQQYSEKQRQKDQVPRQVELEEMRRSIERFQQEREEQKERGRISEEKKREAKRQAAEQATIEALRQAQAEAKQYREAAQRAQKEAAQERERAERAEEAQRRDAARAESDQMSKIQQESAQSRYTNQRELFKHFTLSVGPDTKGVFCFEVIPWAMLHSPTSPSMITNGNIAALLHPAFSPEKPLKASIREYSLTWHSDEFSGRWMQYVLEKDRARVTEGVLAVARAGNEIMADLSLNSRTMSQILCPSPYTPHTPPTTPPRLPDNHYTASEPSPQSLDPMFTIQAQAERCRFLEHQLATERQAHARFREESKMMQHNFQALSTAATQARRELEQEKSRVVAAEKRARMSEQQKAELQDLLDGERVKVATVEHKLKMALENRPKSGGEELARQLELAAIQRCKNQWELFGRLVRLSVKESILGFKDIPWPTFNLPLKPEDIAKKEIQRFIEASSTEELRRKWIKGWLLVWHPDKFEK